MRVGEPARCDLLQQVRWDVRTGGRSSNSPYVDFSVGNTPRGSGRRRPETAWVPISCCEAIRAGTGWQARSRTSSHDSDGGEWSTDPTGNDQEAQCSPPHALSGGAGDGRRCDSYEAQEDC